VQTHITRLGTENVSDEHTKREHDERNKRVTKTSKSAASLADINQPDVDMQKRRKEAILPKCTRDFRLCQAFFCSSREMNHVLSRFALAGFGEVSPFDDAEVSVSRLAHLIARLLVARCASRGQIHLIPRFTAWPWRGAMEQGGADVRRQMGNAPCSSGAWHLLLLHSRAQLASTRPRL